MTQATPMWMKEISRAGPTKLAPNARAKIISSFFREKVVFYPGSGTDGSAIKFFRHESSCFLHVDYELSVETVVTELNSRHPFIGYRLIREFEILPEDLSPPEPINHFPAEFRGPHEAAMGNARCSPFSRMFILERNADCPPAHGPERFALLHLCEDAYTSFDRIFCQPGRGAPYAVVLEDYGYGGNWSDAGFGGEGLLARLARTCGCLPPFLLCGHVWSPWPEYEVVPGREEYGGQHRYLRRLFRLRH